MFLSVGELDYEVLRVVGGWWLTDQTLHYHWDGHGLLDSVLLLFSFSFSSLGVLCVFCIEGCA